MPKVKSLTGKAAHKLHCLPKGETRLPMAATIDRFFFRIHYHHTLLPYFKIELFSFHFHKCIQRNQKKSITVEEAENNK